jgi:hypothetical protein
VAGGLVRRTEAVDVRVDDHAALLTGAVPRRGG